MAHIASGVGHIISTDIAVPEHERELRFYSRVLTTGASPLWREDLMNSDGLPIIGLGERVPDLEYLPLQWGPHIQVADVAASTERALSSGGREILHQKSEDGQSLWAALVDPSGALFGIMPEVPAESIPPVEGGRIAWLDLVVTNAPQIRDFYQDVVGWSSEQVEMEDSAGSYTDYTLCTSDGTPVAGICHARGVNRDLPPVWLICLPVGDLAESLTRVREEGGEVVDARRGSGGDYTYAVIRDPVGVSLALVPGG